MAKCAKAAGNAPLRRDAQRNISELYKQYDAITRKAGLSKSLERMRVDGYKAMSKAELKRVENDGIIKERENWLRNGYDKAVESGDISALTSFEHYMKVAGEIDQKLVGATTVNGIEIEGYVTHFIDRVIGGYEKKREPVSIDDIHDALTNPLSEVYGSENRMTYKHARMICKVGINPKTKKLIQATPKKREV